MGDIDLDSFVLSHGAPGEVLDNWPGRLVTFLEHLGSFLEPRSDLFRTSSGGLGPEAAVSNEILIKKNINL